MAGIQPSADVSDQATVGSGSSVWQLAQVREGAVLGAGCVIGRGAYVGPGVVLGDHCKVQNHALLYEPATLEDGVFVGPAVVLTNDRYPRAVTPEGALKSGRDWAAVGVTVRTGASIGARAVCVAPLTIGRWAMIAAGSVVVRDVPDFALMAGVPARRIGWVGRAGVPLESVCQSPDGQSPDSQGPDGVALWRCPSTGAEYRQHDQTGAAGPLLVEVASSSPS